MSSQNLPCRVKNTTFLLSQIVPGASQVCSLAENQPATNIRAETYGPGSRCVEHGRQWFFTTSGLNSPRSPTILSSPFKIQTHSLPPKDLSLPSPNTKMPSQPSLFPKSPCHSVLSSSTQFPSKRCQFPQSIP